MPPDLVGYLPRKFGRIEVSNPQGVVSHQGVILRTVPEGDWIDRGGMRTVLLRRQI